MKKSMMVIILIVVTIVVVYLFGIDIQLLQKGYTKEQRSVITSSLTKQQQRLLAKQYVEEVEQLLQDEEFQANNLADYLTYHYTYKEAPWNVVVLLINNDQDIAYQPYMSELIEQADFQAERFIRYLKYYQQYEPITVPDTITVINYDIDTMEIAYRDILPNLLTEPYFLTDYLERYLHYSDQNTDYSSSAIVANVNSNLDYDFYTNIVSTDTSKKYLILVNKYYQLSSSYTPSNLVSINTKYGYTGYLEEQTYNAFIEMYNVAAEQGLYLAIRSPYRSYQTQLSLYNSYVNSNGQANADTYSARAGHSEHQTGLAMDIMAQASMSSSLGTFESTNEFAWVREHCYEYGFILRYPKGKEYITGYIYEPWHYRYVGKEVASKIKELGITYEEYYAYFVK